MQQSEINFFWDLYHHLARSVYKKSGGRLPSSELVYDQISLSPELISRFDQIWPSLKYHKYDYDEYDKRYSRPIHDNSPETFEKYVKHMQLTPDVMSLISTLTEEVRARFTEKLGHNFSVLNIRLYECHYGQDDNYFAWHSDHFPPAVKKIMVYFTPPGDDYGTTLVQLNENDSVKWTGPAGTTVLFDNNLRHRAIGPKNEAFVRRALEITIGASILPDPEIRFAGISANWPYIAPDMQEYIGHAVNNGFDFQVINNQNAQFIKAANEFYAKREKDINAPLDCLNIGGGPNFCESGWANLDGAFGVANPYPFKFSSECVFPYENNSMRRIYTSHTFEHLDKQILDRVVEETRRIISPDGVLLIKIPDYDMMLDFYKQGNIDALRNKTLIHKVEKYMLAAGMELHPEVVTSFAHCNFWNSLYGQDHYQKSSIVEVEGAYFGPARIFDYKMLRKILECGSPYQISQCLREFVCTTENDIIWGHQIAFSYEEMHEYLSKSGFNVISMDKQKIMTECADWPEIQWLGDRSMYVLAQKK